MNNLSGGINAQLGQRWYLLFDWTLFILVISISAIGVVFVYSATFASESEYFQNLYLKQIQWHIFGLIIFGFLSTFDYRNLERPAYLLYGIFILLLIGVLFKARVVSGSQRWLSIGGMNVQPSELVKVVLVITLARYYDDRRDKSNMGFRELAIPALIMALPAILIYKQPDLGTSIILGIIFVCMSFLFGIKKRTLMTIFTSAIIALPVLWVYLKPYQKNRVLALLDPTSDPLGIGYHTIQSKIAIGSGGIWGKGLFAGTQSKLNFLPEKHTDFIFSVYAEEVGFIGTLILLTLFLLLFLRMIDIVQKANDRGGSLMAIGCATMITFHFFYNAAMTLGMTPIVGIPMPFVSYGGSALIANYTAVGILMSIHMRRYSND